MVTHIQMTSCLPIGHYLYVSKFQFPTNVLFHRKRTVSQCEFPGNGNFRNSLYFIIWKLYAYLRWTCPGKWTLNFWERLFSSILRPSSVIDYMKSRAVISYSPILNLVLGIITVSNDNSLIINRTKHVNILVHVYREILKIRVIFKPVWVYQSRSVMEQWN